MRYESHEQSKQDGDHADPSILVSTSKCNSFFMSSSTSAKVGNRADPATVEEYTKISASGFDNSFSLGKRISLLSLYDSRASLFRRLRSTAFFKPRGDVNPMPAADPARSFNRWSARIRHARCFAWTFR